ncbi:MAG TPA: pilus assembly protein PilP [Polyangiales bacterium]|nr:pilus assembly protein PilP [Polyangiales bacterium]
MSTRVSAAALLAWALLACEDDSAVLSQNPIAPPPAPAASATSAARPPQAEPVQRAYRDSDFSESEQNRDPFRNYATELKARAPVVAQRTVLMPDTSIDEMKLIAIVSGVEQPCAMLVDQRGVGYVTTRGDFVGKADVVQGGGADALPVALNWRIDRIRDNEVVLAREDPTAPNRPPLTRVIPLHDDDVPSLGAAARTRG